MFRYKAHRFNLDEPLAHVWVPGTGHDLWIDSLRGLSVYDLDQAPFKEPALVSDFLLANFLYDPWTKGYWIGESEILMSFGPFEHNRTDDSHMCLIRQGVIFRTEGPL